MRRRRDTNAALKLLKRLLRNQPVEPQSITTDGLGSSAAALRDLDLIDLHRFYGSTTVREQNWPRQVRLTLRRS
ncbi:DDE-type integrase/transposase/recombinase [Caulobacter sp. AP07]|uniref:DDE-type integrase/transposase/recombinase n=1 Tax=Caulobacter sp. AP07 TaxID=1144304 RepID=UPI001EE66A0E|nr:DDE-type integrase/transposase/recombinase [Caulobacter sp. AP07]